ncbi:LutC/YkgG family protein [Streptomyces lonarensis]|uniref:LutC/YkgG family protein n=1 Tax=Streptomyces lonarensis TaxID=700599 RepID=UPI0028A9B21B|nr:LUD domain-containing protein [Streptomyces lonarensis]
MRDYRRSHRPGTAHDAVELLAANLADYRAHVHRCTPADLPETIAGLLRRRGTEVALAPPSLPASWRTEGVRWLTEDVPLAELATADSVVTGCAVAVAETGTLVLDGGPAQGLRRTSLVPDHHVCVVHAPDQVVDSVPEVLERLDPARPLTWISGPSATSDIELDRVEGVHGPRTLEVVLVDRGPALSGRG